MSGYLLNTMLGRTPSMSQRSNDQGLQPPSTTTTPPKSQPPSSSTSNNNEDPESVRVVSMLTEKKICLEVCVFRTPAKNGTIYFHSHFERRRQPNSLEEENWAIFKTSWKPIESEIAIKNPQTAGPLGTGIDLIIRMLPRPDVPHGYCWLSATSIGSQKIDCSGYSVNYTVAEREPGLRIVRVDGVALAMSWIRKELKVEPRVARLGWFRELGLVKD